MANDTPRFPLPERGAVPDGIDEEMAANDDVQGYYLMPCAACQHSHYPSDPKCTLYCQHGSTAKVSFGTGSQPY